MFYFNSPPALAANAGRLVGLKAASPRLLQKTNEGTPEGVPYQSESHPVFQQPALSSGP